MGPLTVVTLNLAHGRGTGFSQLLQTAAEAEENLEKVAAVLKVQSADVVALQEADGPSLWSGDMDHVALVAAGADYPWYARATHVSNWMGTYGTAMLARRPFIVARGHTFAPSPPTFNKGFLIGRFAWQPDPEKRDAVALDIISVHLDFSRRSVRAGQIREMAARMDPRRRPTIVMGDFNSQWPAEASVVKALARRAGLSVYQPQAPGLGTYGGGKKRLDWILISHHLEFVRYTVVTAAISDHFAVVAEIRMRHSTADMYRREHS